MKLKALISIFFFCASCCYLLALTSSIDSLNKLAWQNRYLNKQLALSLANRAIEIGKVDRNQAGQANSYNILGLIHRNLGELVKADSFFQQGLQLRLALGDSVGVASIYNNLGSLERERGRLERSYSYLFKAVGISERYQADSVLAQCFDNIANTLEDDNKLEDAILYNQRSITLYQQRLKALGLQKDSILLANAYYNLGTKYYYIDDYDLANINFARALPLFDALGDWEGQAWILNILADIAMEQEAFSEAQRYFNEGIALYEQHNDTSLGLFDLFLNSGVLHMQLEQVSSALQRFRKAAALLGNKGGLDDQHLLAMNLAEAYSALQQYDSAYYYQTKATVLQDSLYNIEQTEAIAEMQTRFETERKEKELIKERLITQERTSQRNTFFGLFLAATLLAAAILLIFWQRQKNAKKLAAQEAQIQEQAIAELLKSQELNAIHAMLEGQETERKRIAKDLHDRLGSILTTIKWNFERFAEQFNTNATAATEGNLSQTSTMLDEAYQEVRRISHNMVSGILTNFGLIPALEELCQSISNTGKIQASLHTFGLNDRLESQIEITIYRIVQELISNILKHAKASSITIQISQLEHELNITVEDDGVGFLPEQSTNGMGLKNVEARVQSLSGNLFIDSGKGAGTSIIIEIPS